MKINNNPNLLNMHRMLTLNSSSVSKAYEKIASGNKINSAADDAAGLVVSEKMLSQISSMETEQLNVQDDISLVQTAEGALGSVNSILGRMKELSVRASSATIGQEGKDALNKEFSSLKSEIDRISQSTNFNGIPLLDGTQAKDSSNSSDDSSFSIENMSSAALGLDDIDLTSSDAMKYIDAAISTVSSQRGDLGATQNSLQHEMNNLGVGTENLISSNSRIRDTDYAMEILKLSKDTIFQQSSLSMLSHSRQQYTSILQLIK